MRHTQKEENSSAAPSSSLFSICFGVLCLSHTPTKKSSLVPASVNVFRNHVSGIISPAIDRLLSDREAHLVVFCVLPKCYVLSVDGAETPSQRDRLLTRGRQFSLLLLLSSASSFFFFFFSFFVQRIAFKFQSCQRSTVRSFGRETQSGLFVETSVDNVLFFLSPGSSSLSSVSCVPFPFLLRSLSRSEHSFPLSLFDERLR